ELRGQAAAEDLPRRAQARQQLLGVDAVGMAGEMEGTARDVELTAVADEAASPGADVELVGADGAVLDGEIGAQTVEGDPRDDPARDRHRDVAAQTRERRRRRAAG